MAGDDLELPTEQPAVEERSDKLGKYRLHLSVPKPLSRANLGMPWYEKLRGTTFDSSVPKFGYKGISLQTDSYLFVDIHKNTHFNTEKSIKFQAGKQWLQYASASSWMATKKDATLASGKRITLVAGAGQGQRRAIDHGMEVPIDAYNNLNLHYRVSTVMMGVSEFMTGRRVRADRLTMSNVYDSSQPHIAEHEGFWDVLKRAADLLGPGLPAFEGLYKVFPKYQEGKHHEKYGYGKPYFPSFDPYQWKKTDEPEFTVAAVLALKNASTWLRRLHDVTAMIAVNIADFPLLRQVSKGLEAIDKLGAAADASQRLAYAFGGAKPSNEDKVLFGEEAPFDQRMQDVWHDVIEQTAVLGGTGKKDDKAEVTLHAPKHESDDEHAPHYAWKVPAGVYGYIKVEPTRDEEEDHHPVKTHTRKVPGEKPYIKGYTYVHHLEPVGVSTIALSPSVDPRTATVTLSDAADEVVASLNAFFGEGTAPFSLLPGAEGEAARLGFDPSGIFGFESLTLSADNAAVLIALGLGDEAELSEEMEGEPMVLGELSGVPIALSLNYVDELTAEVAWTQHDTASAGAAAGAIAREAAQAGFPTSPKTAKISDHKIKLQAPEGFLISLRGEGTRLGFAGDSVGPAETITASGPMPAVSWGGARWIVVTTEAASAYIPLLPDLLAEDGAPGPLVARINQEMGAEIASDEGGKLKLKSEGYGAEAFVELRANDVTTLTDILGFHTPEGGASIRKSGEDVYLSPAQLEQLVRNDPSFGEDQDATPLFDGSRFSVSHTEDSITFTAIEPADYNDYKFYIALDGKLFAAIGAGGKKDYVKDKTFHEELDFWQKMLAGLKDLPTDLSRLVEPITDMVQDVVTAAESTIKGLKGAIEGLSGVMGSRFIPAGPPSAIGLFAKDGISMGTKDRVVSAAGKGYVFVADGGSGMRDANKFVLDGYEELVTGIAECDRMGISDFILGPPQNTPPKKEKSGGGGFTVLSNSSTSLVTRTTLDLLAIGSEEKHGKLLGRGIARLAGTRSVEVAGHSRVTITATASAKDDKAVKAKRVKHKESVGKGGEHGKVSYEKRKLEKSGPEGGEVEVLAENIRVGGRATHAAYMPMTHKIPWPMDVKAKAKMMRKLPATERAYAPPTKEIDIEAVKRVGVSAAPYELRLDGKRAMLGALGGAKGVSFEDHHKARKEELEGYFKEQLAHWEAIRDDAKANYKLAKHYYKELHKPLKSADRVEGMRWAGWKKLAGYYELVHKKAEQYAGPHEGTPTAKNSKIMKACDDAIGKYEKAYESVPHAPVIMMDHETIKIGFTKPKGSWESYIEIRPDQITLKHAEGAAKLVVSKTSVKSSSDGGFHESGPSGTQSRNIDDGG